MRFVFRSKREIVSGFRNQAMGEEFYKEDYNERDFSESVPINQKIWEIIEFRQS